MSLPFKECSSWRRLSIDMLESKKPQKKSGCFNPSAKVVSFLFSLFFFIISSILSRRKERKETEQKGREKRKKRIYRGYIALTNVLGQLVSPIFLHSLLFCKRVRGKCRGLIDSSEKTH